MKKKVVALKLKIIFRIIFIQKSENKATTESNPFSDLILCCYTRARPMLSGRKKGRKCGYMMHY